MRNRPYVVMKCAMSIDGYIDDTGPERLLLSNEADADRVDALRTEADAILVGANTIRRDNPRLLVRSPERRRSRIELGKPEQPAKVTVTATADLEPDAAFFTSGPAERFVYCSSDAARTGRQKFGDLATVVAADDLREVLADLVTRRRIETLLVEGGANIHAQFLTDRLADELWVAIAPVFVGDARAPRFVGSAALEPARIPRMKLVETRRLDDMAVLRYRFNV